MASIFVFLGIFFDFFDGLLARKLNVQSELGIQLDSLADMITSGVVPGIILFKLLSLTVNPSDAFINEEWNSYFRLSGIEASLLPFIALLVPMASAYRLGKFNIDENQQTYFIGLPTPANTLMIVSLPLILEFQNSDIMNSIILNKWFLIGLTLLSAYLLNSKIKLFALKFKDWSFKTNSIRYVFILLGIISLITLQFAAIPLLVVIYIVMSLLNNVSS
jgi:CDP-diacylglycerol--serine O-phosphatidyltransferase